MTHSSEVRRAAFVLLGGGCSARRVGTLLGVSRSQVSQWRLDAGGVIKTELRKVPAICHVGTATRLPAPRAWAGGAGDRQTAGLGCLDGVAGVATQRRQPRRAVRRSAGAGLSAGAGASADAGPSAAAQTVELARCPALRIWVQHRLDEHDSPEQVAGRLRLEFGDDESMQISHETIYRAIYLRPRGELTRQLRAHLRTGRDQRRRRATRHSRGAIVDPVSIHDRPEEIEGRLVPGHYEGDLMVGPTGTAAAIGTLVERSSGHLTLFHLPDDRGAEATVAALTATVRRPQWPVLSLTWDRGSEMADHTAPSPSPPASRSTSATPTPPGSAARNENTVSLVVAPDWAGPAGWCRQLEVTLENTGRRWVCLAFDLSLELPTPTWPTRLGLIRSLSAVEA